MIDQSPQEGRKAGESDFNILIHSINSALEVPFYREHHARASAMRDFLSSPGAGTWKAVPFLTKLELQEDQHDSPPYGSLVPKFKHKLVRRTHRTSGTTGVPLFVCYSERDLESVTTIGGRAFGSAGVKEGDRLIHCLNYCMWAGGVTDHLSLERAGANVIPFGVGNTVELIQTVRRLRVQGISCTPSYLTRLEEVLKVEMGLLPSELGLEYALCGGEGGLQDLRARRLVEDRWNIRIVDANYGMAEAFSLFGGECEVRDGLHFHGEEYLFPELVDPESGTALPWESGSTGELVISNIGREVQPLIRYRTGDIIRLVATERCACGEASPRFMVVGRADQMVVIRGINVFPGAVKAIISKMPQWLSGEFRFVVPASGPISRFALRIEKQVGVEVPDEELMSMVDSELSRSLHVKAEIQLIEHGSLPRTMGKTNYLIKEDPR